MREEAGSVSLVGAGCGKADLITLRGALRLQQCTALVYDDLIDPALLELAPQQAERYYMGKRSGHHSAPQTEICALLIQLAREGKRVVRLKGGDPFVFGRGGEEALALGEAGVPCEVIPGISSAIAIPAEAGIPVTHRGLSQSVHIVTAHTADTPDGLPKDLERLAGLHGTLVFLMGLGQMPRLFARLMEVGMPHQTPAAVISGGNAPHPMTVRGTLSDLPQKAAQAGIQPPVVLVVGAVAGLELPVAVPQPLAGITVGITGTDRFAQTLTEALQSRGARIFRAQRFRVISLELDLSPLWERKEPWLVFTSANGVDCFFRLLRDRRIDLRRISPCHFAVIGSATGAALEAHGIFPELCPEIHTTKALGELLLEQLPQGADVLLLRSLQGDPELCETLRARLAVTDCPLYRVSSDPDVAKAGTERLGQADYLVFASAGGVNCFLQEQETIPAHTVCVCIGEVTAGALRPHWQGRILTAPKPSVSALVELLQADAGGC